MYSFAIHDFQITLHTYPCRIRCVAGSPKRTATHGEKATSNNKEKSTIHNKTLLLYSAYFSSISCCSGLFCKVFSVSEIVYTILEKLLQGFSGGSGKVLYSRWIFPTS